MLFVKGLVDSDGLVDLEGSVPVRIKVDWPLGEHSSSSLLLLVLPKLSLGIIYKLSSLGSVAVHDAGWQVVGLYHVVRDEVINRLSLV